MITGNCAADYLIVVLPVCLAITKNCPQTTKLVADCQKQCIVIRVAMLHRPLTSHP